MMESSNVKGKQVEYTASNALESLTLACESAHDASTSPSQRQPKKICFILLVATAMYIFGFVSGILCAQKSFFESEASILSDNNGQLLSSPPSNKVPTLMETSSPSTTLSMTATSPTADEYYQTASSATTTKFDTLAAAPTNYPTSWHPSNSPLSSPPSTSMPTSDDSNSKDDTLVPVNETFYTDERCPTQAYKSTEMYDTALLWVHIYSANNHPPLQPVGPFDDLPPKPINTGHVLLDIEPAGYPVVLALVAYDSMNWTIDVGYETNLKDVIVGGYEAQYVTITNNVSDVRIDIFDTTSGKTLPATDSSATHWSYPSQIIPGALKTYREDLEAYVGAPVYVYDYCYYGSNVEFRLDFSE